MINSINSTFDADMGSSRDFGRSRVRAAWLFAILVVCPAFASGAVPAKARPSIFETTLEEPGQKTPELSTDELKALLAGSAELLLLDARPKHEFAAAHIPASISIDEKGLLRIVQSYPDRGTPMVVYSNGPYCDWARRRSEDLVNMGYSKVSRYQLGLAIWRALGNAAETNLDGIRRAFQANQAVLVDARSRSEYARGTIPAAESVLAGEVAKAMQDHRLQYYDRGVRVIVFGNNGYEARTVAEEIARNAYPNSSFFGGSYQDLKRAKFFSERKPSPSNLEGLTR